MQHFDAVQTQEGARRVVGLLRAVQSEPFRLAQRLQRAFRVVQGQPRPRQGWQGVAMRAVAGHQRISLQPSQTLALLGMQRRQRVLRQQMRHAHAGLDIRGRGGKARRGLAAAALAQHADRDQGRPQHSQQTQGRHAWMPAQARAQAAPQMSAQCLRSQPLVPTVQIVRKCQGSCVTTAGRRLQAALQNRPQPQGQAPPGRALGAGRSAGHRQHQTRATAAGQWRRAGEHRIGDHPQAVDIAAGIQTGVLAARLFGRHVGRRAQQGTGFGHALGAEIARQPEIEHVGMQAAVGIPRDTHIGRFQIAMQQTVLMRGMHGPRNPREQGDDLLQRQVPTGRIERLAVDVLHDQAELPLALAPAVDAGDVRVLHARLQRRFALGTGAPLRGRTGHDLQRDFDAALGVEGAEHLATAAAPDRHRGAQPAQQGLTLRFSVFRHPAPRWLHCDPRNSLRHRLHQSRPKPLPAPTRHHRRSPTAPRHPCNRPTLFA